MKLLLQIASRFVFNRSDSAGDELFSKKKRGTSFVAFIASISVFGLALGVTALLVVTSVMNGFERELSRALTGFHGHILLFSRGEPVEQPQRFIEEVKKDYAQVAGISPYIFLEAMLSGPGGVAGTVVEGIDRSTFDSVSMIGSKLIGGRLPQVTTSKGEVEVTLGAEIARKIRAKVGESVLLTIPFVRGSEVPLVQKLKVVGIVKLGMFEYDNKYSLMEISAVQQTVGFDKKVNAFKILTNNMFESADLANRLNERYTYPLRARDWSTLNRNLFYAIRHEKVVIGILLMAIILVASFNIISTILMLVFDKKRQISMLKALGWGTRQTFFVFTAIAAVLSVLGTVLGLVLARALVALLQWKSLIDLPADIYFFSRLPVEIRPLEWALIAVSVIVLAIASTLLPSYRLGKASPVEGLRYE